MRCEDVTRELASPTGAVPQATLAAHLASCPSCAEWSRRAAQLDRIWEATRPLDPSPERLDALWLDASAALDRREVATAAPAARTLTLPARPWRPWPLGIAIGAGAVGLAQAAALLFAVFLPGRPAAGPAGPKSDAVAGVSASQATPTLTPFREVNSAVDEISVVRIGKKVRLDTIDNAPSGDQVAEYSPFLAFSDMESRAQSGDQVAEYSPLRAISDMESRATP